MTVVVFAGTSEGRKLVERLVAEPMIDVIACVATAYGEALLPRGARILKGRLDEAQMAALIAREKPAYVVDATHPFAEDATRAISAACDLAGARYVRLLREGDALQGAVVAQDVPHAIRLLQNTTGNILLATGAKSVAQFAADARLIDRLHVRVLPMASSIEACVRAGIPGARIIAMQGPFSAALNEALMRACDIRHLVTKASGRAGGLPEKLAAARALNVRAIVLERPPENGLSFESVLKLLLKEVRACTSH